MTKLSTPPLKFCKHLKKHITLLPYLPLCPATHVPITSSRSWGTVGNLARLHQSAADNAFDDSLDYITVADSIGLSSTIRRN